jgi:hypothetical protein
VEKRLAAALKRVNSEAAKRTKANDYTTATAWMQVGEAVSEFAKRAGDFSREWNRLAKATKITASVQNGRSDSAQEPVETDRN